MKISAIFATLLTASCAANSPGITPIGSGLYMHSKRGGPTQTSGSAVKAELWREASAFCVGAGKRIQPGVSESRDALSLAVPSSAEIQFTCVD